MTARSYWVVRVNFDGSDTHADESLTRAVEMANAGDSDTVQYGRVFNASDAGAARLMVPHEGWRYLDEPNGRPCVRCKVMPAETRGGLCEDCGDDAARDARERQE
jgi:hypothetical protein